MSRPTTEGGVLTQRGNATVRVQTTTHRRAASRRARILSAISLSAMLLTACGPSSDQLYGPTKVMVNGEPVTPLNNNPEIVQSASSVLNALSRDLDGLELQLMSPTADAAIVAFQLDRIMVELDAGTRQIPDGTPESQMLRLQIARALLLSGRLDRLGADAMALAMLDQIETPPSEGELQWYRGLALLALDRGRAAVDAFESAQRHKWTPEALPLELADAKQQAGDVAGAQATLAPYLTGHPDDTRAQQLSARLRRPEGSIQIGVEGRSMIRYELERQSWRIHHDSLGISFRLPLSWHLIAEQTDAEGGGLLQILAPPNRGADRKWRSDTAKIWVIPLQPGENLTAFAASYQDSIEGLHDVKPIPGEATAGNVHMKLKRYDARGTLLHGEILATTHGQMGLLVEFWGDATSYEQAKPELQTLLLSLL